MIFLSILGVVMAVTAGEVVARSYGTASGVMVGVVVGFLFVFGLGWKLLWGIVRLPYALVNHKDKQAFIAAWEEHNGSMRLGAEDTYPPPGSYQAWRKLNKRTGISAHNFLIETGLTKALPLLAAPARWAGVFLDADHKEGVVALFPYGIVAHSHDGDNASFSWDQIESYRATGPEDSMVLFTRHPPSLLFVLEMQDESHRARWVRQLSSHGITQASTADTDTDDKEE